ncbi:MAG: serine/threonine-protein kinase [Polyangiaceae bacterium]
MAQAGPTFKTRVPVLAKYEVKEEIGHGGMATVYRAHDPRLARDVAIKVIHPHLRDSPEVAHRFFVEAKAVAKLRHPNIVEVFDVSAPEEQEHYLVVELVRGDTLRKMLQQQGALPPEVAACVGVELLAALAHAHGADVVHRDIKPENVMIDYVAAPTPPDSPSLTPAPASGKSKPRTTPADPMGDRVKVKLTDFGIAKLLDAQGFTSTGQVLGSPAHMAPEQIEGADVDERADVFSMGVLLYECMVGHLPFEGTNPAQVLRRVLEGLYPSAEREKAAIGKNWSVILDRALAHDVADRYPDATAMRDAIDVELKRLGVTSPRGEIEAFFDDPKAYSERHKRQTIEKLCELAGQSRRDGKTLAAAADYNRALAYAPEDRELLRVVTSLHRAESRRRMVLRLAPPIFGAIALGAVAFAVTRFAKDEVKPEIPSASVSVIASASASAPISVASANPSATAIKMTIIPPLTVKSATPKITERTITVGSVKPPFGVSIAVDEVPQIAQTQQNSKLTLDLEKHVLKFTCDKNFCVPDVQVIAAGDHDETINIALKIRPATLTITGDRASTYQITEEPTLAIGADVPTTVPMESGTFPIHVVQLPSNRVETLTLNAGRKSVVNFGSTGGSP